MNNTNIIVQETLTLYEQEKITGNYVHLDSLLDMTPEEMNELIGEKSKTLYKSIHFVLNLLKMKAERMSEGIQFTNSKDVFEYLKTAIIPETLYYEEFWAVYLNRNNTIIRLEKISQGGYSGTVADPKILIGKGLQHKASSVIACHNHPSGNIRPSEADIRLTNKLKNGLDLVDMPLLDHLILSGDKYYSFRDEGLI